MRLEFNIVLIDDELGDEDARGEIDELITVLENAISQKGFDPKVLPVTHPDDISTFERQNGRRIDLYISDNNLGVTALDDSTDDDGIDLYLKLKQEFLCDFILYTRATVDGIISKLVQELQTKKDANLFSRLTFVSRHEGGNAWHQPIIKVIEHMLTKREEINNLRGLIAQLTANIDSRLKSLTKMKEDSSLEKAINEAKKLTIINPEQAEKLHKLRLIRNGILHNTERFCDEQNSWFITYKNAKMEEFKVYEAEFCAIREEFKNAHETIKKLSLVNSTLKQNAKQ